jgi:hypothetical protein
VQYSPEGEAKWRWDCPPDTVEAIPICLASGVGLVTAGDAIVVRRLKEASALDVREIAPGGGGSQLISRPDGSIVAATRVVLHDASPGPHENTMLLLYNCQVRPGYHDDVLLLHQVGTVASTFALPTRCLGIRLFGGDRLVGYWNNMSRRECKLMVFEAPDWSRGTPLDEL